MIKISPFQWSSFNFFGFYCAYGVLLPFLPVWLQSHGYDTHIVGLVIASGYLFRFAGAMFFSKWVKEPNQLLNLNRGLTWAAIIALIGMAWSAQSLWLLLPAIALFHLFNGGAMPIVDTIASTWQQQIGLDYGRSRLFGSIAFVVGSISTGYLVGSFGAQSIIWILTAWLLFLGIGLMAKTDGFANHTAKVTASQTENQDGDNHYWALLKQPNTFRMILAVSLIQASHAAYYAYSTIYWAGEGIGTQQASLLWGGAVAAEIVFFFFANKLFKHWRMQHLIVLSALAAMLRWAVLASTNELSVLAVNQVLHAISYGMGHYAMIRYISTQPLAHIAKLQALYFGSASCVLMALFTFIAGIIYPYSAVGSFGLMIVLALPALFMVPKKLGVSYQSV